MGQGRHTLRSISDPVYPLVNDSDNDDGDGFSDKNAIVIKSVIQC